LLILDRIESMIMFSVYTSTRSIR